MSLAAIAHTQAFAERTFGDLTPGVGLMLGKPGCVLSQAYLDDMRRIGSVVHARRARSRCPGCSCTAPATRWSRSRTRATPTPAHARRSSASCSTRPISLRARPHAADGRGAVNWCRAGFARDSLASCSQLREHLAVEVGVAVPGLAGDDLAVADALLIHPGAAAALELEAHVLVTGQLQALGRCRRPAGSGCRGRWTRSTSPADGRSCTILMTLALCRRNSGARPPISSTAA